jgi:hypothetical protein
MDAKNDGMGNRGELLINVVMWNKPKVLIGWDQKVRVMVGVLDIHSTQSVIPPANRQSLPHRVT